MSEYAKRDIMALDRAGNYYSRHVSAMTGEKLHTKSDIAAELAYRDSRIAELQHERDALAAHVEHLRERRAETLEQDCHEIIDEWLAAAPTTSLGKRDLVKQAEGVVLLIEKLPNSLRPDSTQAGVDEVRWLATRLLANLRQQAKELDDD